MSTPTVIFKDTDKIDIYGFCGDDPRPMWIETVLVEHVERRLASLSLSMGPKWTLVEYKKLTTCKQLGSYNPHENRKNEKAPKKGAAQGYYQGAARRAASLHRHRAQQC